MATKDKVLEVEGNGNTIQKNAFTRWANKYLEQGYTDALIKVLYYDLRTGVRLCALVEILSGKKLPKYHAQPDYKSQMLENVRTCFNFLKKQEGITLPKIESSDIVRGNATAIHRLMWVFICHYSISMSLWKGPKDDSAKRNQDPKQALLDRIKSMIPSQSINNFTTDWMDGTAIVALVNAVAPGQGSYLSPREAMAAAERCCGVRQLITPNEMRHPDMDEKSMMTYLSQFVNPRMRWINLNPVGNRSNEQEKVQRTFGKDVQKGLLTYTGAKPLQGLAVQNPVYGAKPLQALAVQSPVWTKRPVRVWNLFSSSHRVYVPVIPAEYTKYVRYVPVTRGPRYFHVRLTCDPSKVIVRGPGIEKWGVVVGRKTNFVVLTKNAGSGSVDVWILDPDRRTSTVQPNVSWNADKTVWSVDYLPIAKGVHWIAVMFGGRPIPGCTFRVVVGSAIKSHTCYDCYVTGRGIQSKGIRVYDHCHFIVHAGGEAEVIVKVFHIEVNDGGGHPRVEQFVTWKRIDPMTYSYSYVPQKVGLYLVIVSYGGQEVTGSPFYVNVLPKSETRLRAFGPGLRFGVVGCESRFTVLTSGETGALDFSAIGYSSNGSSKATIHRIDNSDGSVDVSYRPITPGEYAVRILFNGEDIPRSPFMVHVSPLTTKFDPTKVEVFGFDQMEWTANETQFVVDASRAGQAPLYVFVTEVDNYCPVNVEIVGKGDGIYYCRFMPRRRVGHIVVISFGGVAVPKSPFRLSVQNSRPPHPSPPSPHPSSTLSRVRIFGPALNGRVRVHQPTRLIIDCSEASPGDVKVSVEDKRGVAIDVNRKERAYKIFQFEFEAMIAGVHDINVDFGNHVETYKIDVFQEKKTDAWMVHCFGPGVDSKGIRTGQPGNFTINASQAGEATPEVSVIDLRGRTYPEVRAKGCGFYEVTYFVDVEGPITVNVTFAGQHVYGSPFSVRILPLFDVTRVHVTGKGVEPHGVTANLPTTFLVFVQGAGTANLEVVILSPDGGYVPTTIRGRGDDTFVVTYTPRDVGRHRIIVKYGGEPVPMSPFYVMTSANGDASNVKIIDVIQNVIVVGEKHVITLDTSSAGSGSVTCDISGPSDNCVDIEIRDNHNGTVSVVYVPRLQGVYVINLRFGGQRIPHGRFTQQATVGYERPALCPPKFVYPSVPGFGSVSAEVTTPSDRRHPPKLEDNQDGTMTVLYTPSERGLHRLFVRHNNLPVYKSPFYFYVSDRHSGHVGAFGRGLSHGIIGQLCRFTIVSRDLGAGCLSLAIECPSRGDVHSYDYLDDICSLSYFPTTHRYGYAAGIAPFDHNRHICGSACMPPAYEDEFYDGDQSGLTASIRTPSGKEKYCTLKRIANGQLGISFVPREVGDYLVTVFRHGKCLPNSPFRIAVSESQIGDAAQVEAHGKGWKTWRSNETREFYVDIKHANCGNLGLSIGEHRPVNMDRAEVNIGFCDVKGPPTEHDSDKTSEEHIRECPSQPSDDSVAQGGADKVRLIEPGLQNGLINIPCKFNVYTRDAGVGRLWIAIEGPSKAEIKFDDRKDGSCKVSYVCSEPGEYVVKVNFNGEHIPGSPFRIHVAPSSVIDEPHGQSLKV